MMFRCRLCLLFLVLLSLALPLPSHAAPATMSYHTLPDLGGYAIVDSINDRGDAVGRVFDSRNIAANGALWRNNQLHLLGTFDGAQAIPFAINNRGDVVGGTSSVNGSASTGFRWYQGQFQRLPCLSAAQRCIAWDINDAGIAVGTSVAIDGMWRPVMWVNGRVRALVPDPQITGHAGTINDDGLIGGWTVDATNRGIATVWRNGRMMRLDQFGNSTVLAINRRGSMLIHQYIGDWPITTVKYLVRGTCITDLSTQMGRAFGANALNDRDQVAGPLASPNNLYEVNMVALWSEGRLTHTAPLPAVELTGGVNDLNNRGELVGAISRPGWIRAIKWRIPANATPPEPTAPVCTGVRK